MNAYDRQHINTHALAKRHPCTCQTRTFCAHTQIYTNFFAHALAKHVLRTHTNLNKLMHCETFRFAHAHTCVNMLLTCTLAGNMLRRLRNDPAMDANDQPVRFRTLSPSLSLRLLLSLPRGSCTCTVAHRTTCTTRMKQVVGNTHLPAHRHHPHRSVDIFYLSLSQRCTPDSRSLSPFVRRAG